MVVLYGATMAEGNLSQSEADALIAMEKIRVNDSNNDCPTPGGNLMVPLTSRDGREAFILDVSRSQINLAKVTHRNRARQIVVLMRLDMGGRASSKSRWRRNSLPSFAHLSGRIWRQMGGLCA